MRADPPILEHLFKRREVLRRGHLLEVCLICCEKTRELARSRANGREPARTSELFFTTGITFQIPLVQVILGLTEILTSQQMLNGWKYVLVGSTIIGAILTPSTDPITQICLSLAVIFLYMVGILILKIYGK